MPVFNLTLKIFVHPVHRQYFELSVCFAIIRVSPAYTSGNKAALNWPNLEPQVENEYTLKHDSLRSQKFYKLDIQVYLWPIASISKMK